MKSAVPLAAYCFGSSFTMIDFDCSGKTSKHSETSYPRLRKAHPHRQNPCSRLAKYSSPTLRPPTGYLIVDCKVFNHPAIDAVEIQQEIERLEVSVSKRIVLRISARWPASAIPGRGRECRYRQPADGPVHPALPLCQVFQQITVRSSRQM